MTLYLRLLILVNRNVTMKGRTAKRQYCVSSRKKIIIFRQEMAKLVSLCEASDTWFTQAVICSKRDEFAFLF